MTTQPFDHGIPLLTEVLSEQEELAAEIPASEPDTVKPGMFQTQPDGEMPGSDPEGSTPGFAVGAETNTHPSPVAIEPDWEAIEARLTQRILHQVQGKIDHLLEERIAHVLQTALQNALIGMRGALREDLQQSLEQIVAHAVSHELGHLHRPAQ